MGGLLDRAVEAIVLDREGLAHILKHVPAGRLPILPLCRLAGGHAAIWREDSNTGEERPQFICLHSKSMPSGKGSWKEPLEKLTGRQLS